jgi:hypothetical protein
MNWHPLTFHMLDVAAVGHSLIAADARLCARLATVSRLELAALPRWLFLAQARLGRPWPRPGPGSSGATSRKPLILLRTAVRPRAFLGGVLSRSAEDLEGFYSP